MLMCVALTVVMLFQYYITIGWVCNISGVDSFVVHCGPELNVTFVHF